jgi:hypothetical protein
VLNLKSANHVHLFQDLKTLDSEEPEVYALDARNERRRELLQELVDWRNAIAHQDFDPVAPGGSPTLQLGRVRGWRSAVNALTRYFDQAMYNYLQALLGAAPW